jgi:hypothetical protein
MDSHMELGLLAEAAHVAAAAAKGRRHTKHVGSACFLCAIDC